MPLDIIYHTTGVWGLGVERNLNAPEVDLNFYNIKLAIVDLQTNPPQPNSISSITVDGKNMTIRLLDGVLLGPFPLPVLEYSFRGEWTPFTVYRVLDVFTVEAVGQFGTLEQHTSGAIFNPDLLVSGEPAYKKMFGFDPGGAAASRVHDLGFFYPGRPQDSTNALLIDYPMVRAVTLPITADQHEASLTTPPSTTIQVYPIKQGGTHLGDITFAVASNVGVFSWIVADDVVFARGDHLTVGKSAATDAAAVGLAVNFALIRITT